MRTPAWFSAEAFGKGDRCYKCGNASINSREGRPFGPKSRQWSLIKEMFEAEREEILKYAPDTVKLEFQIN